MSRGLNIALISRLNVYISNLYLKNLDEYFIITLLGQYYIVYVHANIHVYVYKSSKEAHLLKTEKKIKDDLIFFTSYNCNYIYIYIYMRTFHYNKREKGVRQ